MRPPPNPAPRAPCCDGRGSTAPRSPSGGRPETPGPSGAARAPDAALTARRPIGSASRTNGSRPNWKRHERRSTSWGKFTRALGGHLQGRGHRREVEMVIDDHHPELAMAVGTKRACELLGRARATHYRRRRPPRCGPPNPRPTPPNALSPAERQAVLELLHRPEHCDLAVAQVWGRTLDYGTTCARSPPCTVCSGVTGS